MQRDFTYIDDIVAGVVATLDWLAVGNAQFDSAAPDPATSHAPYRVYNIGNNQPVGLLAYIECMERAIGAKAVLNKLPMRPGDMTATCADIEALRLAVGFAPSTSLEVGMERFIGWLTTYAKIRPPQSQVID